mgnify:CR=1 FL=1
MKDTLKTLELLEEHIDCLAEQGIYEIERDLLLESLRRMYTSVLSIDTVAEEEKVIDALLGLPKEFFEPSDEEMYGCPPAEFKEIIPEEEVAEEPIATSIEEEVAEPTAEPTAEPEPIEEEKEDIAEVAEAAETQPGSQPESDEIDHEALISLYDDDDEEEPAVEEESTEEIASEEPEVAEEEQLIEEEPIIEVEQEEEEPVVEEEEEPITMEEEEESQSVVLGDILSADQPTLADNLAEQIGTDVATAVGSNLSLRQTIAINDKFILLRDLFGGNNDYYEAAIEKLDSFDNLDEAMLYIYDHFHWNPNSEGARLLMELLARKLF